MQKLIDFGLIFQKKLMLKNKFLYLFTSLFIFACSSKGIDYKTLDSFDKKQNLRAVIEIPAGTNDKIEYKPARNSFEIDSLDGQPRVINFLPYPINYGFVPSTRTSKNDDDPLDILVYAKPLQTGQIITVRPIGILKMTDDGEIDDKVLSIPVDSKYQIIDIKNFEDLSQNHPKIRDMIANWFLYYDKNADIKILGWSDESKALKDIKALQISKPQADGQ